MAVTSHAEVALHTHVCLSVSVLKGPHLPSQQAMGLSAVSVIAGSRHAQPDSSPCGWGLTGFLNCQHAHGVQGTHCLSDISLLVVQDHFTSQSTEAAGQDKDSVPEADKIDVNRIPSFGRAEGHLTVNAEHYGALQPLLVVQVPACMACQASNWLADA